MIEFNQDKQDTIPSSLVKIIGLGGAGANMLDRVALDGMEGAEMLALNADIRTLSGSVASDRIQLGRNLTKGLGTGGDPALGQKVMLEAEKEVRAAIKGRKIVFLCVGLGGGTGSGGAPILTRIAREEGAFCVVFATMPFQFEGLRRREQAESALNELAVLSNALVVFDNNRMGELVLAKQGIHEAFSAGDRMISDSIKAVIRLVIRPGLIHVGLDELMTALRTTRSRCLFGSGLASGKDRAAKALANALSSPLLDKGALLKEAVSVLVHICGGDDLTLYEIELLMQKLMKYVPAKAHVLFGAAIDSQMKDSLSITLISALPEEKLQALVDQTTEQKREIMEPSIGFGFEENEPEPEEELPEMAPVLVDANEVLIPVTEQIEQWIDEQPTPTEEVRPFAEAEEEDEQVNDFSAVVNPPTLSISPAVSAAAKDLREALQPSAEVIPVPVPDLGDLLTSNRPKLGQKDLLFEEGNRGKFSKSEQTLVDGDDLDIPPFLRNKKK
jgi:cell division protein FtsZ